VTESKRTSGLFGLLSNGAIHRSGAFRDAVVAALTVFLRPELQLDKT
jgi:non-canonical (house-cleaning) NTP pyrophosphatase